MMKSHLGLRCAPQTKQTHSKQGASQEEVSGKGHPGQEGVCSVTVTVIPEGEAQSHSCPATGAPHICDSEHTKCDTLQERSPRPPSLWEAFPS